MQLYIRLVLVAYNIEELEYKLATGTADGVCYIYSCVVLYYTYYTSFKIITIVKNHVIELFVMKYLKSTREKTAGSPIKIFELSPFPIR